VLVADPVGYGDFVRVLVRATVIVTDSGGIQEEAPSLRVPVLVARTETERTEALEAGLTKLVGAGAADKKIDVVGDGQVAPAGDPRKLVDAIRETNADCLFVAGAPSAGALALFDAAHAALPRMKLFGSAGLAEASFARRIPLSAQPLTFLTRPTLPPSMYPKAGQSFIRTYRKAYGSAPDPYAIYGYEAMQDALQAIRNAGDRADHDQAVIDGFFQIKNRDSALGTYSIDERGDTTLSDYGGYGVRAGRLVFRERLKASV
jgi:branched-chain amino acid transport system substrate-binding protein